MGVATLPSPLAFLILLAIFQTAVLKVSGVQPNSALAVSALNWET